MKGLLLKDLVLIKKQYWWSLFILVPLLILMPQLAILFMLFVMVIPTGTFESDTTSKWEKQVLMMPVSRKQYVLTKYLLGLVTIIAFIILVFLSQLIASIEPLCTLFGNENRMLDFNDFIGMIFLILLIIAIQFPLMFQFGSQKGSIITLMFFSFFIGIMGGLDKAEISVSIPEFWDWLIFIVLPIFSFWLSTKIVDRKWKKIG